MRNGGHVKSIRGQGSTLPAALYANWLSSIARPDAEYSYNAPLTSPGDFFARFPANTGSVAGKAAFVSHIFNNNTYFPGGRDAPAEPLPSFVTTEQKEDIQFVGSDAILTSADFFTDFYASYSYDIIRWGEAIQVPSVGTPVTLAFNQARLTLTRRGPTGVVTVSDGTQATGRVLYLSRASYCGIFTGGIANWNHPRIVIDNGVAPSNQPITVVVRSDGSGTSEIISRHLDTVCDGSAEAGGYTFPATNTSDPNTPTGRNSIAWSDLIPASRLIATAGDGGVSTAIANTSYSIGYLSPSYTDLVATPAVGTGSPAPSTANLQNQFDVNAGRNNYTHSASWTNVQVGQRYGEVPALTDDPIVWGRKLVGIGSPSIAFPTDGDSRPNNPTEKFAYPIIGYTFLDFYTCYPDNRLNPVTRFVNYFTTDARADVEAKRAGFAPLRPELKERVRERLTATGASPRGLTRGPVDGYCTL